MVRCFSATELRHASPKELPTILDAIGGWIGAVYYCLSRPHIRESEFAPFVVTNFPAPWSRSYLDKKYFRNDPVFAEAARTNLPLFRDETLDPADPAAVEVVAERRNLGCRSAMVIPVRGRNSQCTVLSFWSRDDLEAFRPRCEAHHDALMSRVAYVHDIAGRALADSAREVLTDIELECLKWTSVGKTAWAISVLLDVSERTVHYHLAEASKKLGAPNKTGAVGIALRHGLLDW